MKNALRLWVTPVIVSVCLACDNVEWGGIRVALETPPLPEAPSVPSAAETPAEEDARPILSSAPILFAGRTVGERVRLTPLAFLESGGPGPLPESAETDLRDQLLARLAPGMEAVLYADGVRVGSFVAASTTTDAGTCPGEILVDGVPEVRPSARSAQRFLALSRQAVLPAPPRDFQPPLSNRDRRAATLDLATAVIAGEGAIWPPSVLETRQDVQVLSLGGERVGVAGTFLYQDRLAVSPAPNDAYSIFVLGEETPSGYAPRYRQLQRVGSEGKAAPRFFQQLDWDGDGEMEVVLEVLGSEFRWHRILDQQGDSLSTALETHCDTAGSATPR